MSSQTETSLQVDRISGACPTNSPKPGSWAQSQESEWSDCQLFPASTHHLPLPFSGSLVSPCSGGKSPPSPNSHPQRVRCMKPALRTWHNFIWSFSCMVWGLSIVHGGTINPFRPSHCLSWAEARLNLSKNRSQMDHRLEAKVDKMLMLYPKCRTKAHFCKCHPSSVLSNCT